MIRWLGVFLALGIGIYLFLLAKLIRQMKRQNPDYWDKIGNPDMNSPTGQVIFFSKIFIPGRLPEGVRLQHESLLLLVRMFAVGNLVLMIIIGVTAT